MNRVIKFSKQSAYRPEVDGLRALSIAAVVLFHYFPVLAPAGFVGVDIFFVISGYLITRLLLSEPQGRKDEGIFAVLIRFYARRVRRLFPTLAIVIFAALSAGLLLLMPNELEALGQQAYRATLFSLNFLMVRESGYFDIRAQFKPLLHLWSLSVEEQFYIVWPICIIIALRFRRLRMVAIILLTISFIANIYLSLYNVESAFYLPYGRAWEFLVGAIVAMGTPAETDSPGAMSPDRGNASKGYPAALWPTIGDIGFLLVVLSVYLTRSAYFYPGLWVIPAVAGSALYLGARDSLVGKLILTKRPFVFIGKMSYSIYLWHWPIISIALLYYDGNISNALRLQLLAMTIVASTATYYIVEKRSEILFARSAIHSSMLFVGASVLVGVFGYVCYRADGFIGRYPSQVQEVIRFRKDSAANIYAKNPCLISRKFKTDHPNSFEAGSCTGALGDGRPTLMLVGDSHAASLSPGVSQMASANYNFGQLTAGNCVPMIPEVEILNKNTATERCRKINEYVFEEVKRIKPAVLVIGTHYSIYDHLDGYDYPDFLGQFVQNVNSLQGKYAGKIIVVGQFPAWPQDLPTIVAKEIASGAEFRPQVPVSTMDQRLFQVDARLKAARWQQGVSYVSVLDEFCNAVECRRAVGKNLPSDLISVDSSHLSEHASEYVAKTLIEPLLRK